MLLSKETLDVLDKLGIRTNILQQQLQQRSTRGLALCARILQEEEDKLENQIDDLVSQRDRLTDHLNEVLHLLGMPTRAKYRYRYVTIGQVAEKFGVSEKTIRRKVNARQIPYVRTLGHLRFPLELLDDWVRQPELITDLWFNWKPARVKEAR